MTRFGWILAGVISLIACENASEPLQLGTQQQAIRNGTREPAILALNDGQKLAIGWLHPTGAVSQNFCTGTLVAPRVVATARHCIDGNGGRPMSFGMGLLPRDPVGTFPVESIHVHPFLDAAILILRDDVLETLPEVRPIPFNRTALDQSYIGNEVEAAGYGETYDRTRSGRYFAVVELAAVTPSEVIVNGRGRQGLCFGDSGGPVMAMLDGENTVVLGVESWGDPSCVGVDHLIRLDAIAPWIDSVTEEVEREPDPECVELPEVGVCDGALLKRCQNGRYVEQMCDEQSERCQVIDETTGVFGCAEYDPCAEVGSSGVCDGQTVVRCRFGELIYDDCSDDDQVCRQDSGGAFCGPKQEAMDPPTPDDVDEVIDDASGGGQLVDGEGQGTSPELSSSESDGEPRARGQNEDQSANGDNGEVVITGQTGGTASDGDLFFDSGSSKEANVNSGGCNTTGPTNSAVPALSLLTLIALWRRRLGARIRGT